MFISICRHKHWLHMVSQMFGGMQVCSIDVLVNKEGLEMIHDVNNDVITLLGDSQDEDRRALADLIAVQIGQSAAAPPPPTAAPPPLPPQQPHHPSLPPMENGATARPPPPAVPPPRPVRQPSLSKETPPAAQQQDDTMGQLKRTFAGIFGDM